LVSNLKNLIIITQLRLDCPQSCPVPLEPWNTLHERVGASVSAVAEDEEKVSFDWCDLENLHVYIYVNLGEGEYHSS
jgi:hypothetical protein